MALSFELHPLLQRDGAPLLDWPLCRLLLMKDANYPWLVLVPRRAGVRDFHDVAEADRAIFHGEIRRASQLLSAYSKADKMNVAALGNLCPQLHVHVIARFERDAAWPKPVWGQVPAKTYEASELARITDELQRLLVP